MLLSSFVEIGPMVLEKKFLKGFSIYEHGGHLGHVSKISRSQIQRHYTRRLQIKFQLDQLDQAVSEKIFDFFYFILIFQ